MKRSSPRFIAALAAMIALIAVVSGVGAQLAGTGPEINWYTIDGGGGTSSGGAFSVSGTIGQPDAGGAMTGGALSVTGGFWPGAEPINECPGNTNGDSNVNVTDLLAVISAWGMCPLPCPPNCSADVAPAVRDCTVNVTDLLAVISAWGPCP